MRMHSLAIAIAASLIGGAIQDASAFGAMSRAEMQSRALSMVDLQWSPAYTFYNDWRVGNGQWHYAGTAYRGVTYSQNALWIDRAGFLGQLASLTGHGSYRAFGNDCSAFVSIVWQLPSRWSTHVFHSDANGSRNYVHPLGGYGSGAHVGLMRGDAFNHQTAHILLFDSYAPGGGINSLEQTPPAATRRYWSWSSLAGYQPIRRNQIAADAPPPPPPNFTHLPFVTGLHPTNADWQFIGSPFNNDWIVDLVAINKKGRGGNPAADRTTVHILDGAGGFKNFSLHAVTALHHTGPEFEFRMADWNGDGHKDLFAIKKWSTAGSTEVHILNGATNFSTFLAHLPTGLHPTDHNFEIRIGNFDGDTKPDLIAIKKNGATSTEVHVWSGASNFQSKIFASGTALHKTDGGWSFDIRDTNRDGKLDLVAFARSANPVAVHVLDGARSFQSFLNHNVTRLHSVGPEFELMMPADWNFDGYSDMWAIKKWGVGSGKTELHMYSPLRP